MDHRIGTWWKDGWITVGDESVDNSDGPRKYSGPPCSAPASTMRHLVGASSFMNNIVTLPGTNHNIAHGSYSCMVEARSDT